VIVVAQQRSGAGQTGAQDRWVTAPRDLLEVGRHLHDACGVLTATARLDEVKHGRPAHEAVKRWVVLVKHRPERTEGVVVPSLAQGGCAPGKVRGREQRTVLHRPQCALRPGDQTIEVGFAPALRRGEGAHELAGESVLRLASVACQARRLGTCPLGPFPIAGVGGRPRVVDQRLRERA
jgi:hypothetical protein